MSADPDQRLQLAYAGLHPDRAHQLRTRFGAVGALRYLEKRATVGDSVRAAIGIPAAERRRELAAAGYRAVYADSAGYPEQLAELPGSPDVLFVRGSIPFGPAVAIVGTRACTTYGRRIAERYGTAVAAAGWTVVSGLARGVDGAAHRGAVAVGGRGVAVLGCGLDVAYPPEHASLADELVELGGAVVSEYPPGTRPEGWRFPPRNRIISGLSGAVVIVEAAVTGGALITARYAIEHGRPVFVLPGDITRPSSEGCNLLIKDGAHPVLDPGDLVAELEFVLGPAPTAPVVDGAR